MFENQGNTEYPSNEEEYQLFLNNYTYQGSPLYDYSFWTILRAANFSFEFISMMADVSIAQWTEMQFVLRRYGGYYEQFLARHPNATYNYSNYGYWTLRNGFDSISQKLYNLSFIENEKDGKNILLNNRVISIEKKNDNRYIVQSTDLITNSINRFSAENVILSIGVSHLKKLLPYIPVLDNEDVGDLLDSVVVTYIVKLNLIYDDPFWIDYDLQIYSRSLSNTEISRFSIEDAFSDNNLTSIIFELFQDRSAFWNMMQLLGSPYPIDENIQIVNLSNLVVASTSVVKYAVKILNENINFTIPMPLAAFYAPWGYNLSFGDSVAFWKVGYKMNHVLNDIFQPNKDENIFIAVNDFSLNPGWSDGAYWAANQNLMRNFNISSIFENEEQCTPF